jgi:uncharacterized protein (DUF433 family)
MGNAVQTETIEIIDCGRGPQLSNSRITVQDVLPFYRERASNDEIRQWLPSLTDLEIAVVNAYICDHYEEVCHAELEIKALHDLQRAAQPEWTRANDHLSIEKRKAILRQKLSERPAESDRAHPPVG